MTQKWCQKIKTISPHPLTSGKNFPSVTVRYGISSIFATCTRNASHFIPLHSAVKAAATGQTDADKFFTSRCVSRVNRDQRPAQAQGMIGCRPQKTSTRTSFAIYVTQMMRSAAQTSAPLERCQILCKQTTVSLNDLSK